MRVSILSVGDELTLGFVADTNAQHLAASCAALGGEVAGFRAVPDRLEAIVSAIGEAAAGAEFLLVTGGIGPTPDDLTREAVAAWAGVPLKEDPGEVEKLLARYKTRGKEAPGSSRRQARFPSGARVLPNERGTAPGFALEKDGKTVVVLPGVPSEMKAMFEAEVVPLLAGRRGGAVVRSRFLRTFGELESRVGERLRDLMERGRNPDLGTLVGEGIVSVRITARAAGAAEADALLSADAEEVRRRLGEAVFGEGAETIYGAAARALLDRSLTLALAESCTGGLLAARITETAGVSKIFREGAVTYSNEAKTRRVGVPPGLLERHGAVSAEVAGAMARGARSASGADLALSITGIAGPDGGTAEKPVGLVYLGLAFGDGLESRRFLLSGTREEIRDRATKHAADWIRRCLLPLPSTPS